MAETIIVQTTLGPVKGVKKTTALASDYFSFQSIPYAKPPIGELRFRDPQPAEPWTDVLDSTQQGPCCPAKNNLLNVIEGEEDCLHINVFTKSLNPNKLVPVMIYIHGGAFMRGSSGVEMYGPDFLLQKDVILFTFNYRLGAFGFLSVDDQSVDIPGNAGLKDQSMAIRWCKENAAYFGGDPNNVTLFGESAGGCSVHYHMISEQSRGLFHKAIVKSGAALNCWSVVPERNWAKRLAVSLGWSGKGSTKDMIDFLRKAEPKSIVKAQESLVTSEERKFRILFPFGPVIEPYITSRTLIPRDPLEMCRNAWSHSIPIIIGGTSDEGLFSYREAIEFPNIVNHLSCDYLVPLDLDLDVKSDRCQMLGNQIKKFYFGDQQPSMETLNEYIMLMTDKLFWHGVHRTILSRLNAPNAGPTFLYRFNFDSPTFNHYRVMMCGKTVRGVCHADDLSYIFKNTIAQEVPDAASAEFKTIQRMVNLWVSFAANSDPNCHILKPIVWRPLAQKTAPFECLNISDELTVIKLPETERMKLWDSLYSQDQLY
ncbi:esterase B1-like [Phlebotomus argentipes]|uniref:esterase B1-like n=1 Tax=Phlebotomus argentipes TaxID=94469 RepID=UPI0028932A5A|nr:esterase B1-like [Phlebotomus argentipes]